MGTRAKAKSNGAAGTDSLSAWKKRSLMQVTLPSGAQVLLRAVTLDELFAEEAMPEHLIQAAVLSMQPGGVVRKIAAHVAAGEHDEADRLSRDNVGLRDRLVLRAVVEPRLTEDDLADLDVFDKAMIAELAQRVRVTDAAGRRVGADALDTFRTVASQLANVEVDETRRTLLVELAGLQ